LAVPTRYNSRYKPLQTAATRIGNLTAYLYYTYDFISAPMSRYATMAMWVMRFMPPLL
jgi:hypothetical protein